MAALDLILDIPCRYHQLPEVIDLARAFPELTIVLNHVGGITGIGAYENRRDEIFCDWRTHMTGLATCENVSVKLGGLAMEYCGFGWHQRDKPPTSRELADATSRYNETVIDLFGPDRAMFESNFPVDKVSTSYNVLWNSFKLITTNYTAAEKAALYHNTASRIYRLDERCGLMPIE